METLLLSVPNENSKENIKKAAEILKSGGLVAIPTETVYGLAASAFSGETVKKIYSAKGRPSDNPLIVHIAEKNEIYPLVTKASDKAEKCMDAFWPGPFTAVLKKSDKIPTEVSGGLDTVALRCPQNKIARAVISAAGLPLAAPSANSSGLPSPTTANHVISDLMGKIDAILVSPDCEVGVESTVVTFATDPPRLLRPGGITAEQLREILPDLVIDPAVTNKLENGQKAASPGMKYKHYSPAAEVVMVSAEGKAFADYCNQKSNGFEVALCFEEDLPLLKIKALSLGGREDYEAQAERLFARLRELDDLKVKKAAVHAPNKRGMGLAVYNRLIRAAGFKVVEL